MISAPSGGFCQGFWPAPVAQGDFDRVHLQAFSRADMHAFLAADAGIGNHGMNLFGGADYGISRADFEATGTTGAGVFADPGNHQFFVFALAEIDFDTQQFCKLFD
jgi:hypothetical protein